jgi:hypothetical protein
VLVEGQIGPVASAARGLEVGSTLDRESKRSVSVAGDVDVDFLAAQIDVDPCAVEGID